MKIKGQQGEFGWLRQGEPVPKRQIEIGEGERLEVQLVRVLGNGKTNGEMIMDFFMPGMLTLEWEQGKTLGEIKRLEGAEEETSAQMHLLS
ncbi:MAG TPA: hypothetical protein VMW64_08170 [Dehalococcoidia bacterium]|nr:hypothetical protein [Dehalococcoidia bacterium]